MDLLATVRKEGSRGGTGDFKWSDVQNSARRENYLGHSVMAPVGRWQKGRDLSWYSRADADANDGEDPAERAERERKEEIRKIKEAEEDALARALGLPVAPRNNANMEPLGNAREVDKVLRESAGNEEHGVKGVGYGTFATSNSNPVLGERIQGNAEAQDKELQHALKEYRRRHGEDRKKGKHRSRASRSRSRSPDRDKRRSRYEQDHERPYQRRHSRSRSVSRERHHHRKRSPRSRSESKSRADRRRHGHDRQQRKHRSRSPYRRSDTDWQRSHRSHNRNPDRGLG